MCGQSDLLTVQRLKHHPFFASLLEGGECLAYGARALNEGGYQSIPKLTVPGAALIGDSAGFLNVPKIKGTHTSMQSGILAADAVFDAVTDESASGEVADVSAFQTKMDSSWVMDELRQVRNIRPSFHNRAGVYGGMLYSGIDSLFLRGKVPWTFHHPGPDYAATRPADQFSPIQYPSPDGKLSFDILTSVSRTGTNHAEDQPVHLVVKDGDYARHVEANAGPYAGLLNKACPAGVYEVRRERPGRSLIGAVHRHERGRRRASRRPHAIPDQLAKLCVRPRDDRADRCRHPLQGSLSDLSNSLTPCRPATSKCRRRTSTGSVRRRDETFR